jgi:tRNA(fMet)-specific endonuclease VapC
VRYILDTDTCIWALREKEPVFSRVRSFSPDELAVTAMTEAELRYGALNSRDPASGLARVEMFLSAPIESLPFDSDAASWHAELRLALRHGPIGERDLVIASVVMASAEGGAESTFVTRNRAEFTRVPGLLCEDWTEA